MSGTPSPVKSAIPTQEALLPLLENCVVFAAGKVPIPELRKTVTKPAELLDSDWVSTLTMSLNPSPLRSATATKLTKSSELPVL